MTNANAATWPPRELFSHEVDAVSGGMKWVRGTKNSDVIDARGGSFTILGWRFTVDISGNLSSASRL